MRSRFVVHCEKIMRYEIHRFIAHEVDLTTCANINPPLFGSGDLELCKTFMHTIARYMDLSMEMQHLSTRLVIFKMQEARRQQIHSMQISPVNCGLVCTVVDKWPLNIVSNTPDSYLQYSSAYSILDQNDILILYLPFTNEMRTDLHCRLIEATKRSFVAFWSRKVIETRHREFRMHQNDSSKVIDLNRAANWKAERDSLRERFLTRVDLQPPELLRVIDIEATCRQRERVVLIDYRADGVQQVGYTCISHTYGMPVYEVFNCRCASECSAKVHPRCLDKPCPHEHQDAAGISDTHKSVVNDILTMCDLLRKAGVNYAWHDGVCIAQHNESEVQETIKHMGWIYANAKETIIFLHYVGSPMAPIRNSDDVHELGCRWHTRVWTLQEAALSKCRRYCVRLGTSPLGDCQSLEEFEEKIDLWYGEESSTIEIIEEEAFFEFLKEIHRVLCFLCEDSSKKILSMPDDADDEEIAELIWMLTKVSMWNECTMGFLETLLYTCFRFPRVDTAICMCGPRQSKHLGDYINSILAIAEVKDFVAPKDENVEASTIEFFKRQGQRGLAMAVFSINNCFNYQDLEYLTEKRQHTWPPVFGSSLILLDDRNSCIGFEVLEDGRMELSRTELICVKVKFTAKLFHKNKDVKYKPGMYVNELEARDDLSYLEMDLNVEHMPSELRAKLSENAARDIGLTCESCQEQLPSGTSVSDIIMGRVHISAIEKCSYNHRRAIAKEIEDGDSIHTHLVIPAGIVDPTILIVQGASASLDAPVSKVGLFKACKGFTEMVSLIRHQLPAVCTTIHKLIII